MDESIASSLVSCSETLSERAWSCWSFSAKRDSNDCSCRASCALRAAMVRSLRRRVDSSRSVRRSILAGTIGDRGAVFSPFVKTRVLSAVVLGQGDSTHEWIVTGPCAAATSVWNCLPVLNTLDGTASPARPLARAPRPWAAEGNSNYRGGRRQQ